MGTGPSQAKHCQTCGLSLGPGCAKSEQAFHVKEEQKLMRNDTKIVQVCFIFSWV